MKPRSPGFSLASWLALVSLFGVYLALPRPVWAQSGDGPEDPAAPLAQLTAVNSAGFPAMEAYVLVNDAAGQQVPGLTAGDFHVTENDQTVSGLTVAQEAVGVQVVFVLDSTDAFKTRDINGITRLDQIQEALTAYAQTGLHAGLDDVTILTSEGPLVQHTSDPQALAEAVAGYTSTFTGVADPFTLFNSGLDFVADLAPRPGMPRFLIFLSSGLAQPDISGQLADAATRAAAVNVPVYTLFVGPAGGEGTTAAVNLQTLAESTGGQRLLFTDATSLDPFLQVLDQHGEQYRLTYRSRLAITGQHTLAAAVTLPGGTALEAGQVVFPLRIEAPMVTLGSLPPTLVRLASTADQETALVEPTALSIPLIIDFPDGHPRGLTAAELVVDGLVVASLPANTNTVTALTWPLAAYDAAADHVIEARLTDELGLSAASPAVTINVSLQRPAAAAPPPLPIPAQVVERPGWPLLALALIGVALAAGVGVLAWWALTRAQRARAAAEAGLDSTLPSAPAVTNSLPVTRPPSARSKPRPVRRVKPAAVANQGTAPLVAPPAPPDVTQPAAPAARPGWMPKLPHVNVPALRWPTRPTPPAVAAPAYFEVVEPGGGSAPRADIELAGAAPLTLGRDGAVADTVFHDRSVSRLHCRLVFENGVFRVYDANSTSGTWVNYAPIAAGAGVELRHNDLINLGRVQLRFKRRDVPVPQTAAAVRVVALPVNHVPANGAASNGHTPNGNGANGSNGSAPHGPTPNGNGQTAGATHPAATAQPPAGAPTPVAAPPAEKTE